MNKMYTNLLIVACIVSAVNLNTPYCMENEKQLQKVLGMKFSFKNMHNMYFYANILGQKKIIKQFFQHLFGNNGDNLKKILSCNIYDELLNIYYMLRYTDVKDYVVDLLKNNDALFKKISNIVNDMKYNYLNIRNKVCDINNKIDNIVIYIVAEIKTIILMKELDMDGTFKDIYDMYSHSPSIADSQEQIEKFCNCLFGMNGKNLITILSCNVYDELININCMLYFNDIKKYLVNLLNNNDVLFKKISEIVNSAEYNNNISNEVNNIVTEIKTVILMKSLDMDVSFTDIYENYFNALKDDRIEDRPIQIKKFFNYLFGKDGKNLEKILLCQNEHELSAINAMLKEDDTKEYLIRFLKNQDNNLIYNQILKILNIRYSIRNYIKKYQESIIKQIQDCMNK